MNVLVTGSSGLIGSEAVTFFDNLGFDVTGVDNNMRATFFGSKGDTTWNRQRLESSCKRFRHQTLDIRNREAVLELFTQQPLDLIVHAAAQPSHDLAARIPFDDFDVNAVGTLNLLEACRRHAPEAVFIFMSTNKVYGDGPNRMRLKELDTRWDFEDPRFEQGIDEAFSIDQCLHSLFGASKVAADVLTQEYGRYFGMKTGTFRAAA
jgi:CDP-paratose 2-epimerase